MITRALVLPDKLVTALAGLVSVTPPAPSAYRLVTAREPPGWLMAPPLSSDSVS